MDEETVTESLNVAAAVAAEAQDLRTDEFSKEEGAPGPEEFPLWGPLMNALTSTLEPEFRRANNHNLAQVRASKTKTPALLRVLKLPCCVF